MLTAWEIPHGWQRLASRFVSRFVQSKLWISAVIGIAKEHDNLAVLEFHRSIVVIKFQNDETVIDGKQIRLLFPRQRFDSPFALELVLYDGCCYFFDFVTNGIDAALKELVLCATNLQAQPITNPVAAVRASRETEQWIDGSLSTFEYLFFLNGAAGRTFSDLALFPVFPWVFCDYAGASADRFRDFSRPVDPLLENSPHAYDRAVSPDSVSRFLARTPFGAATAENFASVQEMYESARSGFARELIPEFFYFPDFLAGVSLPIWARSPANFVYRRRSSLPRAARVD
jgi:hypothetical protein